MRNCKKEFDIDDLSLSNDPSHPLTSNKILFSPMDRSFPRLDYFQSLSKTFDSCSLTDIDVDQNDETISSDMKPRSTSVLSRNFSSATTNLSAYSTQSLLRKLLDKAQLLDQYYNKIYKTSINQSTLSLTSSSSNSCLGRSSSLSHSLLFQSKKNSSSKRYRQQFNGHLSSDSSRFDLYNDEDNVLRELIRFNNDIDLILSRLEMDDDHRQLTNKDQNNSDSFPVQQSNDDNHLQSTVTLDQPSQINEQ